MVSDVTTFVSAVLSQFFGAIGALSTVYTGWAWLSGKDNSLKWGRRFMAAMFLVAFFLAWRDERDALGIEQAAHADTRVQRNACLDDNRPGLAARLHRVDHCPPDKDDKMVTLLVAATITNVGAPVAIQEWGLRCEAPSGEVVEGKLAAIEADHPLFENGKQIGILHRATDSLADKTLTPIPRNGTATGWLHFTFAREAHDMLHDAGSRYALTYMDVTGELHEQAQMCSGPQDCEGFVAPGIQQPFTTH